jgi:predicted MPP superfamily phosphohydrolase
MFHTILTLSYTIPGIYLFIRIWQLFIAPHHRWWYILAFAILFLVYPSRSVLADHAPGAADLAAKISDYLLPFFLYLFLFVLLTDLLLVINRLTGAVSTGKVHSFLAGYRYFFTLMVLSLFIVIAGIINFNTIRTTEYSIEIPARSSQLRELKVAFVSDFHLDENVPARFVEKYVKKMKEINPDVLFYGGDIVEGSGENIPRYEAILSSIKPVYGVYGVLGNHDRIRNFRNNFFTRAGIILLRDSIVIPGNSFIVAGRIDNRNSGKDAARILANIPNLPVIMIDHRPTDYENISKTATDLVLSGHTHKGQLFPVNLYLNNLYELSYGNIIKGNTHCIVSSGIRLWGPKVRTTGKSEIVIVRILFSHPENN